MDLLAPTDVQRLAPPAETRAASARSRNNDDSEFLDLLRHSAASFCGEESQTPAQSSLVTPLQPALPVLELSPEARGIDSSAVRTLSRIVWDAVHRSARTVELRLLPEGMGSLTIDLQLRGDVVHLRAEATDPRVVRLLLSSQQDLAQGLARWGLTLGSFKARCPAELQLDAPSVTAGAAGDNDDSPLPVAEHRRSMIEVVI